MLKTPQSSFRQFPPASAGFFVARIGLDASERTGWYGDNPPSTAFSFAVSLQFWQGTQAFGVLRCPKHDVTITPVNDGLRLQTKGFAMPGLVAERWLSGLRRTPGKPVSVFTKGNKIKGENIPLACLQVLLQIERVDSGGRCPMVNQNDKLLMRIAEIVVTEIETGWKVSGTVKGQMRRKQFSGPDASDRAFTTKQAWEREIQEMAPLPVTMTRLTDEQCKEAEHCFRLVEDKGHTLSAIVNFGLANFRPAEVVMLVGKAIDQFVKEKEAANKRPISIRNLKQRLVYLGNTCGNQNVNNVLPDVVQALINRPDTSPRTRLNYRLALSNFFNWCVRKKYCAVSPLASLESITVDVGEPHILTVEECRRLMRAAVEFKDGALVPYVTLALFCGIRPTEVTRLTWADVDLADGTVTIGAGVAKMRGRRIVEISENADAFLSAHELKKTSFAPRRRDWDALRREAGWTDLSKWVPDALRHTAISMHLARHTHEGKTAAWAGNSPDMIQKHYKGLVKSKAAQEFWSIAPETLAANVVQLDAKAA